MSDIDSSWPKKTVGDVVMDKSLRRAVRDAQQRAKMASASLAPESGARRVGRGASAALRAGAPAGTLGGSPSSGRAARRSAASRPAGAGANARQD
jgi:hypothetical protein